MKERESSGDLYSRMDLPQNPSRQDLIKLPTLAQEAYRVDDKKALAAAEMHLRLALAGPRDLIDIPEKTWDQLSQRFDECARGGSPEEFLDKFSD